MLTLLILFDFRPCPSLDVMYLAVCSLAIVSVFYCNQASKTLPFVCFPEYIARHSLGANKKSQPGGLWEFLKIEDPEKLPVKGLSVHLPAAFPTLDEMKFCNF